MATPSLEQVKRLLAATQVIASHQARIARLSGLNFNVFRLLRMEEDEVRLHSRLIAELLDPRGSHGQGSAFLEMFLRQVECSLPSRSRIDAKKARVEPERYIGRVELSDADPTGGRIDIFITDGTRHISIENKIDHGEGDHQVERYCNYEPESNFVLYLTPDGRCANTEKSNSAPISYGAHIVPWLERCHKHCTDLPVLRESIKQYLVVVRKLTGIGDPLMQEINEDAKRLLRQNMEAAHLVYRHFMPTIYEAVREFARSLERKMTPKLEPHLNIENTIETEDDPNGTGLEIWSECWPIGRELGFVKWQYYRGDFEYGVISDREQRDEIKSSLGESVGDLRFKQSDQYWAFYKRMDNIRDLENDMGALSRLFDEQEQAALADEVACKRYEVVSACDRKFNKSAS